MPNNTNCWKEDNTTQSKNQSHNINFKETRRPQVLVNEFPERQHTFQLKEDRARLKYFPRATSNDLLFFIEPTLGEGQFDTAKIHVGINDLLNNTAGTDVLLQNILKIATRWKMHGINKIFVSSVLNTYKVSSDLIVKLF